MTHRPLEGRLIRLRSREPNDTPLAHEYFNNPEVTEHLAMRYPVSIRQEYEILDAFTGYTFADFAVETLEERRFIGSCSLRILQPELRRADLGVVLGDTAYWDGGYGTDTVRTLCRFGFDEMNLHRIELIVFEENTRARHVYEKLGFQHEGVIRDGWYQAGHYQDLIMMGLLEGELVLE